MRIGILTFYKVLNYGAVLQAYALQNVLRKMGHDVFLINYQPAKLTGTYRKIVFRYLRKPSYVLRLRRRAALSAPFAYFESSYLTESRKIATLGEFRTHPPEADAFIVGSDQVWNLKLTGLDKGFFFPLETSRIRRISYAASCGGDYTFLQDEQIIGLLKQFNSISVREKPLQDQLSTHASIDSDVVLDPTLILDDYNPFISDNAYGKYIIVYNVVQNRRFLELLKYVKSKSGLKIINMGPQHIWSANRNLLKVSPEQWVNLIYHAQYVFTNSFHGVAFSVKFRKRLLYIPNHIASDDRVTGLLNEIGLADTIIKDTNQIDEILNRDAAPVPNDRFQLMKNDSLKFLANSLR